MHPASRCETDPRYFVGRTCTLMYHWGRFLEYSKTPNVKLIGLIFVQGDEEARKKAEREG